MAGIADKLDAALALLRGGMVFNVLAREGRQIEVETVIGGEVKIMSVREFSEAVHIEAVELSMPAEDLDVQRREQVETLDQKLTRADMAQFAAMVDPRWKDRIREGGIDGEVPEVRAAGNGVSMRANVYLFGGRGDLDPNIERADDLPGLIGATIRVVLPDAIPLKDLGLANEVVAMADETQGLILIVGPAGAGKSTTAVSYIDHLNTNRDGHIVTAEDPIEFIFREKRGRVSQREVGSNAESVERVLQDAMRNFAMAAFVGELRTAADKRAAFEAAQRGLLVVATGFANNAVDAIRSLVNDLPGRPEAVAASVARTLLGVTYQVKAPSLMDGQWVFVHESVAVRHRGDIQELIERSEWDALQKRLTEGGASGGVRSLNEALIPIIKDKRLDQQAATRCAYDRADLARKLREVSL
ncbi:ATPase, T2SS/T4P/T4SS family [Ramlibacter albus]|uniref:Flp pilus assembly complex ATPase component TadA n=1 Tax=Ramlibacter albus TaxID=2079448 RepID=A0A923S4I6_9BURK|nr:ATPase, T2SS/T4P/T4SS family [Ramlibacter albus]MBC5767644.1 Flp pilus assembly complex ATPase component TadA [Ramlibacter albus]